MNVSFLHFSAIFSSILAASVGIVFVGCEPRTNKAAIEQEKISEQKEKLPEQFRTDLNQFLISSEEFNTMLSFGISKDELRRRTAGLIARFELLTPIWPGQFVPAAKHDIASAVRGWTIASSVDTRDWIRTDNPLFAELQSYAALSPASVAFKYSANGQMIFGPVWDVPLNSQNSDLVKDTSLDNTSNLLTIASSYFDRGKVTVISNLALP